MASGAAPHTPESSPTRGTQEYPFVTKQEKNLNSRQQTSPAASVVAYTNFLSPPVGTQKHDRRCIQRCSPTPPSLAVRRRHSGKCLMCVCFGYGLSLILKWSKLYIGA